MRKLWIAFVLALCGCRSPYIHTAFLSQVCIKPYKAYRYHVCHDINVMIEKERYTIPAGFQTDLASIPRIAWSIMSPAHSALIRPAIVHDWFYRKTCIFDRKQTDQIFFHMLINDGVPFGRAFFMYYAVRAFGWPFYTEDYCDDIE